MKINKKIVISLILMTTIFSCSSNPANEIYVNQSNTNSVSEFKASDKQGATISFKINFSSPINPLQRELEVFGVRGISSSPLLSKRGTGGEFSTKANANGTPAKTPTDISRYVVYLVKDNSTSSYPLTGDPLNTSNIVAGPFNIAKTSGSQTIRFTNIQPLATGAYYVAVKAQDSGNVDIIKVNNGSGSAWTGTTSTTHAGKVAVSTGAGVTVSSTYVVSTNTPVVNPNLLDAVGARIDANINSNSGLPDTVTLANTDDFITTIAGNGTAGFSGDNGQATSAQLFRPTGLALDSLGNIYIADANNNVIRKVTVSTGVITTVAGTTQGFSGDGAQATVAQLSFPTDIRLDSSDNLYIADRNNHRVRKVTSSTGIITTIAGTGTPPFNSGFSGDGSQSTNAQLNFPTGVALDSLSNLYISDASNNRIRKITASTGVITTIAGTTLGFSGDNGQATSAQLNRPQVGSLDSFGNLYISDSSNHRIRKITASTGIITTIAGDGTGSFGGDSGQATLAKLNSPSGVTTDSSGNLYIADASNHRIRKITASTGVITTIAGNGTGSFGGDGGASTASTLNSPEGLTLDSSGNLYIADYLNHRIRKIYKN